MAVVVLAAGCGAPSARGPVTVADDRVPFGLLRDEPATTTTTTPAGDLVGLCLVGADGLLHQVSARVDLEPGPIAALQALSDARDGLTTAVPDPAPVRTVDVVGGVAAVDLAASFGQLSTEQQRLAIAQTVCTLTSLPGVGQVRFTLAGTPIDVPDGTGALLPGPVARDDYAVLLDR
jgi:hypothetical protein